MDRSVVERKLVLLRRCVQRLRSRRPATAEQLASDADLQDVLVPNLSRAVQVCVDIGTHLLAGSDQPIPTTMGETFSRLADAGVIDIQTAQQLRKAVGFRNIAGTTTSRLTGASCLRSQASRCATSSALPSTWPGS